MTVDIVTPNWNYAHYLPQAIASVISQTYQDWKLWIIDDGSDDNSLEVIAKWQALDNRITGLSLGGRYEQRVAKNVGAAEGGGEFLIFLDSDDMIAPSYIRETTEAIGNHAYCYTDNIRYWPNGRLQEFKMPDFSLGWLRGETDHPNAGPMSTSLMRRSAFEAVGGYEQELTQEDWVLAITLAVNGHYGVRLAKHLFYHRFGKGAEAAWGRNQKYWPGVQVTIRERYPDFFAGGEA